MGQWRFVSGSRIPKSAQQLPIYGNSGIPSSRIFPSFTVDHVGRFWLLGGDGHINSSSSMNLYNFIIFYIFF